LQIPRKSQAFCGKTVEIIKLERIKKLTQLQKFCDAELDGVGNPALDTKALCKWSSCDGKSKQNGVDLLFFIGRWVAN
jgi:hypothetical protein